MSAYYWTRMSYRFVSQLDPDSDFKTKDEARAHDRKLAYALICGTVRMDFAHAVAQSSRESVAALRFWADDIEDALSERGDLPS